MNRTIKMLRRVAFAPFAVWGARTVWQAFAPAISEAEIVDKTAAALRERVAALKERLERSDAVETARGMLRHEQAALEHAEAYKAHKLRRLEAQKHGTPAINAVGDKVAAVRGGIEAHWARRDAAQAKEHLGAAVSLAREAEQRKWQAIAGWWADTWAILRDRFDDLRSSLLEAEPVQEAEATARELWAEHGWGSARAAREARKQRKNIAVGALAGLAIGAGVVYLLSRRNKTSHSVYGAEQAQLGHGATSAARADTTPVYTTGAVIPSPGPGTSRDEAISPAGAPADTDEAWIVIPQEQWAEFIQRISESHEGWLVRVENEGSVSMYDTPVEEAHFTGMQLEPSMARPGVRIYVGTLPEGFFEHLIPDLRTLEHMPSDEAGYQGLRFTTTVDRVTIRFTDPGAARDVLAQ